MIQQTKVIYRYIIQLEISTDCKYIVLRSHHVPRNLSHHCPSISIHKTSYIRQMGNGFEVIHLDDQAKAENTKINKIGSRITWARLRQVKP